ncbi:hypothetical protein AM593_00221, partial [Mytilus galloprovincialis]
MFERSTPSYSNSAMREFQLSSIWEYEDEKENVWIKYEDDINIRIERAYIRKPTGKTIVKYNKGTYIICFTKMTQLNTSSGKELN